MRIVALVPSIEHVSTRYRVWPLARYLAAAGYDLEVEPLERNLGPRLLQVARPRRDQIVLLQRRPLPLWQLRLLKRSSAMLAYDFDDAVYLRESFHPRGPNSLSRRLAFRATIKAADLIFAGNSFLAGKAREVAPRGRIFVVPTCVDVAKYQPARHAAGDPARLVWIGGAGNLRRLEVGLGSTLSEIGRNVPAASLRVICNWFPQLADLRVEPVEWSSATEADRLAECAVGVCWLPSDAWSPGKCGLKTLQYLAAGLPVLANPVGVHREMVTPAIGRLVDSPAAWTRAVREFAASVELRQSAGAAARALAEKQYDIARWAPLVVEMLRDVSRVAA